jgi:putative transposase
LRGHDYAQPGMYYVTLTIQDRQEILGSVVGANIRLTVIGEIVREEWLRTPIVRPEVMLDEFVIMPDHLHGIVVICEEQNGVTPSMNKLVGANRDSPQ